MTTLPKVYIGVDISKDRLDIHIHPLSKHVQIKNSEKEIQRFVKGLNQYNITDIGCEATGGYEKLFVRSLGNQDLRNSCKH